MNEIKEKKMGIKGKVEYVLYDEHGNIKQSGLCMNTITELHDALVADRLAGGTDLLFTHGHAGTGTGGTSASTNLVTAFAEARTAVASSTQGAGAADNDVIVVFTLGAGVCTGTVDELGIFSSAPSDAADMKAYSDNAAAGYAIPKGALDTLAVTWTFTYGSS
jgi:hypothetical protein